MRKFNLMSAVAVIACYAAGISSCTETEPDNTTDGVNEISGYVTEDMVLASGQTYYLTGSLQVQAPATLTIQPGVQIIARDNGEINYILIEQGAKIDAQGTASAPIVMTSETKEAGAWGGLHICGYSHTNATSGVSEIGNAPYGGEDLADNSGTLKYIRLEYTGYSLDDTHEANGISLYGVGSGTSISYVQIYRGSDDGIEFFGGSVNIDHCVVVDCSDDSYDWTEGWNGTADYIVAYQSAQSELGYDCDCLMECDNNSNNAAITPISNPTINHATLIGNSSTANSRGIRLRAGTYANISNTLVSGKTSGITLETTETVQSFINGDSSFSNVALSSSFVNEETSNQGYLSADFVDDGNLVDQTFSFTGRYVGTVDGRGAVSADNDWTAGWTL